MSNGTFPQRFTKVDDLTRADHWYLTENDACYFIGEYTARMGFSYSTTNNLVLNFKKTMDRRGTPEWRYKERAIDQAAVAFRTALGPNGIDALTFVPMPPSKAKGDPLYDDRLIRLLNAIRSHPPLDVRELIIQIGSTEAVHGMEDRPKPHQIEALYRIDGRIGGGVETVCSYHRRRSYNGCTLPSSEVCTVGSVPGTGVYRLVSCKKDPRKFGSVVWLRIWCAKVCTGWRKEVILHHGTGPSLGYGTRRTRDGKQATEGEGGREPDTAGGGLAWSRLSMADAIRQLGISEVMLYRCRTITLRSKSTNS